MILLLGWCMKKVLTIGLIIVGILISGCATKLPKYSNSVENYRVIKAISTSDLPVKIGKFTATKVEESSTVCRLSFQYVTPDNEVFNKYIENALAAELEMGGMSDPSAKITISGNLDSFFVTTMLGDSYWEYKMKVISSNGKSFDVVSRTDYQSNFVGVYACNNMFSSYLPSMQNLINKIVTDSHFPELLK